MTHLSTLLICYHLVITDKIIATTTTQYPHNNRLPSSSNLGFGSARQGGEATDGEEPGVQGDAADAAGFLLRRPRLRGPPRRWHEWHAARLASLSKSHTVTWEEFKKKQKEDELKRGDMEADKDRMMREYRAQLDAERAKKLAHGRNHSSSKSSSKKDRKLKDEKKRRKKRRKHKSSSESSSGSSSESSSSDEEDRDVRKSRSRSRSKKSKKEKKHMSRSKHVDSDGEEEGGPVRLSKFFGNVKS